MVHNDAHAFDTYTSRTHCSQGLIKGYIHCLFNASKHKHEENKIKKQRMIINKLLFVAHIICIQPYSQACNIPLLCRHTIKNFKFYLK